jgi:hypothetical protein
MTLTTEQKNALLNSIAVYPINNLKIQVKILDWREKNFGRFEVQIEPVSGTGKTWVAFQSVTVKE